MKVKVRLDLFFDNFTDVACSNSDHLHINCKIGGGTVATLYDDVKRDYMFHHYN